MIEKYKKNRVYWHNGSWLFINNFGQKIFQVYRLQVSSSNATSNFIFTSSNAPMIDSATMEPNEKKTIDDHLVKIIETLQFHVALFLDHLYMCQLIKDNEQETIDSQATKEKKADGLFKILVSKEGAWT